MNPDRRSRAAGRTIQKQELDMGSIAHEQGIESPSRLTPPPYICSNIRFGAAGAGRIPSGELLQQRT